mgnify:CR=1 FL=1
MLASLIGGIFGTKNERELKRMRKIVDKINALEPTISALSDADLSAKTEEFKQRYNKGESLDQLFLFFTGLHGQLIRLSGRTIILHPYAKIFKN